MLLENARGNELEREFASAWLEPAVLEEFESIVARSNSFLFLFQVLTEIVLERTESFLKQQLKTFVFYMQLGDDLTDWRKDFQTKHYTSFLRECFAELGRMPNEHELEGHVLLSGIFERRLERIILGFGHILRELQAFQTGLTFCKHVEGQRDLAVNALTEMAETKINILT